MAVTTSISEDPMKILRESLGAKLIGNVMNMSTGIDEKNDMFKYAVEKLAQSIAEKINRSGLAPVAESGKVFFGQPNTIEDYGTITAKIYAAWSDKPMDLLIFCVQAMEDARESAKQSDSYKEEYRGKYINLLEGLASAKSMKQVRELVRTRDYDL